MGCFICKHTLEHYVEKTGYTNDRAEQISPWDTQTSTAVIYFHWFPAVMDFAGTTSLYLTLRMKHLSAYVHLCGHKHTQRDTR